MHYIYLHGFLSGPNSNKGKFLGEKFRHFGKELIRPDLNAGNFSRMTISSQLIIIGEIIDSLSGPVVLLGSSLGGYLSLLTAEKYQQVKKLVLMAPAMDFAERYLEKLTPAERSGWKNRGFISLYHFAYQRQVKLDYAMAEDALQYRRKEIKRKAEVLVFHGLRDESVPYTLSIDYLKGNPQSSLILFNTDHGMLDHLEKMWIHMMPFLGFKSGSKQF